VDRRQTEIIEAPTDRPTRQLASNRISLIGVGANSLNLRSKSDHLFLEN
jgi:hypothetical protein